MSNHDNNSIRKNGWWSTCTKSFTAARWNTGKTDRTAATKQYDEQQTLRFIKIIEDLLNENTILKRRLAVMENTSLLKLNTKKLNEQLINTEHHPGFPLVEESGGSLHCTKNWLVTPMCVFKTYEHHPYTGFKNWPPSAWAYVYLQSFTCKSLPSLKGLSWNITAGVYTILQKNQLQRIDLSMRERNKHKKGLLCLFQLEKNKN